MHTVNIISIPHDQFLQSVEMPDGSLRRFTCDFQSSELLRKLRNYPPEITAALIDFLDAGLLPGRIQHTPPTGAMAQSLARLGRIPAGLGSLQGLLDVFLRAVELHDEAAVDDDDDNVIRMPVDVG